MPFVFVRSGAGGREGELGSVLLSVRRGSLLAQQTQLASRPTHLSLNYFECLNWQGLKNVQIINFRDDAQQWLINCPERLFWLASAVGPYNLHQPFTPLAMALYIYIYIYIKLYTHYFTL